MSTSLIMENLQEQSSKGDSTSRMRESKTEAGPDRWDNTGLSPHP